jgi:hypothetical protein
LARNGYIWWRLLLPFRVSLCSPFDRLPCARNTVERSGGIGTEVWLAVGVQVALFVLVCLCYGASVSARLISTTYIPDAGTACSIQALCSFSLAQPHRTELLSELRTPSRSCRCLSFVLSGPRSRARCGRCRSTRNTIVCTAGWCIEVRTYYPCSSLKGSCGFLGNFPLCVAIPVPPSLFIY